MQKDHVSMESWVLRQSQKYGESIIPKEEGREVIGMLIAFFTFHDSTNTFPPFRTGFSVFFKVFILFSRYTKTMLMKTLSSFWYSFIALYIQAS